MKTKFYFLVCFLFATLCLDAQTWTLMDSVNSSNSVGTNYYDFSSDGTHGMVSGGYSYRSSTNSGSSWSSDVTNIYGEMRVIKIIDNSTVFAAQDRFLFKSSTFGSTWGSQITTGNSGNISDLKFNGTNGILVSRDGEVAYSTDGGTSWTKLASNPFGDLSAIYMIEMLSPTIAYVSGANSLFMKTTDGGQTWSILTGPALTGSTFNSATSGCYSDGTNIYRTTDGGSTWTVVSTTGTIPNDVSCYNATIYYGSKNNLIYKSVDAGNTWTLDYTANATYGIHTIKYSGTSAYAIVGFSGGSRWVKIDGLPASVQENDLTSQNAVLYPNPTNGSFQISFDENLYEQVGVRIFDNLGKEVCNTKIIVNGNVLPLSVGDLKAGMYLVEIQAKNERIVKNFMLK